MFISLVFFSSLDFFLNKNKRFFLTERLFFPVAMLACIVKIKFIVSKVKAHPSIC